MSEEKNSDEEFAKRLYKELEMIGIDISTPEGRAEFRQTILWAQSTRKRSEKIKLYIVLIALGGILSTIGSYALDIIQGN